MLKMIKIDLKFQQNIFCIWNVHEILNYKSYWHQMSNSIIRSKVNRFQIFNQNISQDDYGYIMICFGELFGTWIQFHETSYEYQS